MAEDLEFTDTCELCGAEVRPINFVVHQEWHFRLLCAVGMVDEGKI